MTSLSDDLKEGGKPVRSECFINGTFMFAKKGTGSEKDQAGHRYRDLGRGRPFWSSYRHLLESTSPHDVTLVEVTIASRFISDKPQRLIGDRAYDSNPLDSELREGDIELIAPHRKNRVKSKT